MNKIEATKSEMVKNLAVTAKDCFLGFLKTGKLFSRNKLAQQRMNICLDCPYIIYPKKETESHQIIKKTRCSKCGCFLKPKISLIYSRCPIDEW